MSLPPEDDIDHSWIWHNLHWNIAIMGEVKDSGSVLSNSGAFSASPAPIIPYKKYDWLEGLRDRKCPASLIPWPLPVFA